MAFPNMQDPEQIVEPSSFEEVVADARSMAREQMGAAWQLHLDRIREQIDKAWRENLDEVFESRFAEVETRLRRDFDQAVLDRATSQIHDATRSARESARRDLTSQLNHIARRLKQADSRDAWGQTLLEAASAFSGKSALFWIKGDSLTLGSVNGMPSQPELEATVPLSSAPAFATAAESKDTVVTIGSQNELSEAISYLLADSEERRVYLLPIVLRENTAAVVYAEPGDNGIDLDAMELLVSLAAVSIEPPQPAIAQSAAGGFVNIQGVEAAKPAVKPSWSELPKEEQDLHLRAQRFARTEIAQFLLHRVHQVRSGRASNDLYGALREEIDAGRESFREQFLESCPSMVDYYHLELLRTLAKDRADAFGPDYPGPLAF